MSPDLVMPLLLQRECHEEGVAPMSPTLVTPLLPLWECQEE